MWQFHLILVLTPTFHGKLSAREDILNTQMDCCTHLTKNLPDPTPLITTYNEIHQQKKDDINVFTCYDKMSISPVMEPTLTTN